MKRRLSGPSSIRSFFDSVGSGSSSACLQRREPRAYFCLLPDLMWKPGWHRSWGHGSRRLCSWEPPARPCHLQDFSSSRHRENASPGRALSITWNIVAKSITKICLMGAAFCPSLDPTNMPLLPCDWPWGCLLFTLRSGPLSWALKGNIQNTVLWWDTLSGICAADKQIYKEIFSTVNLLLVVCGCSNFETILCLLQNWENGWISWCC